MKRSLMLVLMFGLLALALPALATPIPELTSLASYYPEKTVFFASIRTDEAFFDALDAVVEGISENVPEANLEGVSFRSMLDEMMESPSQTQTFDEFFGPWLGDTMSFGIVATAELFDDDSRNDSDVPMMFAAEITNREALVTLFQEQILPDSVPFDIEQGEDFTLITSLDEDVSVNFYINDDTLMFTNQTSLLPEESVTGSLYQSADFSNSLSYLPETDYNAIAYINLPEVLSNVPAASLEPEQAAVLASIAPVIDGVGGQVIGATILDDRSLTLDYVQPITDPSAYEAMGISIPTGSIPVSFDFAEFIPAGTPLVIQGTDLQTLVNNGLANLASYAALQEDLMPEGSQSAMEMFEEGMDQLEFSIAGLTGLSLQDDILSWMTGNYALALGISPTLAELTSISDAPEEFPVDFSVLIEATDPDAAQALVDGMLQAFTIIGSDSFELDNEEIGGSTAYVITIEESMGQPFPVEILFGASEDVFVVGTPRMVRAALNPDGGLASDPSYVEMQQYALDEPVNVYYAAGEGLTPLVNLLVLSNSVNAQDDDAIANVFRLISSSSITSTIAENGTTVYRMVLTLPDGE